MAPGLLGGGLSCLWCSVIGVGGFIGLAGFVLWIWMIVECATKETDQNNNRLIWILIIVLTHWIGALIYLVIRRPQRIRELGQ